MMAAGRQLRRGAKQLPVQLQCLQQHAGAKCEAKAVGRPRRRQLAENRLEPSSQMGTLKPASGTARRFGWAGPQQAAVRPMSRGKSSVSRGRGAVRAWWQRRCRARPTQVDRGPGTARPSMPRRFGHHQAGAWLGSNVMPPEPTRMVEVPR